MSNPFLQRDSLLPLPPPVKHVKDLPPAIPRKTAPPPPAKPTIISGQTSSLGQMLSQRPSEPKATVATPKAATRSFGDVRATRQAIFENVRKAAMESPAVENQRYSLGLADAYYSDDEEPTPEQVKQKIMEGGSVTRTLKGTWVLKDKETGQESRRSTILARVPYMLDNGTLLRSGTKYAMRNQSRLLPGVYSRRKENGEFEVHVNADMRDGAIHHYDLAPETGQMSVVVQGGKTPIYGLAKAMGATDEEMINAWGEDLWRINRNKFSPPHIAKLHGKLSRGKREDIETDEDRMEHIRESLERIKLNPEVMEATLGKPYDHMSKDVLLASTKKLLAISRGEAESDDRDNLSFQEVYGPEDIFAERMSRSDVAKKQLLHMLTRKFNGDVSRIPAGFLTKSVDAAILSSGLSQNIEEVNPLNVMNQSYSLTKLGTGGIPNVRSVADESRDVHPTQRGYIDPSRTPESDRVGVDTYLATNSFKGADRQLYSPVIDKEGNEHLLRPRDMLRSTVATAAEFRKAADDEYIPVMQNGKETMALKSEVDYMIPNFEGVFSPLANLVPFKSAAMGNRVAMGARMLEQALPVTGGESPFVQTGVPGEKDKSYYQVFGKEAGAIFADNPSRVLEATDTHILLEDLASGAKKKVPLHRYSVSNRKTYLHNTPMVEPGQVVQKGQVLAKSNYTNDQGEIAMGLNANVVMIPWKGYNFEDAMVVSQSFADRMKTQHMYQNRQDWSDSMKKGKHAFMGIFPSTFDKSQLDKMDESGVIRVGETVRSGDPIILAASENKAEGSRKGKPLRKLYSDATTTWDHHSEGVVTDVFDSPKGTTVLVKMEKSLQTGDKLSNRFGNKSVIRILPDEDMPMTEDGTIADIAMSPAATVSRGNPVQILELALGKIARKTGKVYRVSDFEDIDDLYEFAMAELRKHGIEPDQAVIDRKTGKKIRNADGSGIPDGSMWIMPLHHESESKVAGRGIGGYSSDETPSRGGPQGSKRMAQMHLNALVGHGAYNTFMDARLYRGQANDDYWLQYMSGVTPQMKKTPLVYQKFENSLKAAGINIAPRDGRMHILAMTDADVQKLAGDREVKSGDTLRWEKSGKPPIPGGLFDPGIFGMDGTRWGKLTPVVPILNPVMEEPTRILLGLKQKELQGIMSGEQKLGSYGTGFSAIQNALSDINVPLAMNRYRSVLQTGNAAQRDHAVRALGTLKGCEQTGLHPKDWMLSSLPILPPKFRPVSAMKDSDVPLIDDANYLYNLMIDTNRGLKDLRKFTRNTAKEEYGLYDAYKQVTGLADPTHPKLVQRQVRGLLKHVFGPGTSKWSMVQRSLLGTPTDMVGRAVIVPDPDLDLDTIGIPESKAWEVYRPHVMHRLTKRGMPWAQAASVIEERKPLAKDALLDEMKERPVIADRAPVLHKFGVLAFNPVLVADDTLHLNSFIQKGFGADYDGDMMNFHVPASKEAVAEAYNLLMPSKSLLQASTIKNAQPSIISENAGGLYLASLDPDPKERKKTYVSWEDAVKAYKRGELAIDDPVEVLSSKPLPRKFRDS